MRAALRLTERDHVSCSATIQVLSLFVSDGYSLAFPECPELGAVSGAASEPGGDAAQVRWDAQFVRETIDNARDLKMTEVP